MNNLVETIAYYSAYDVENRMKRDQAHYIEFLLSMKYINFCLSNLQKKTDLTFADIGCGTGNYTIELAKKCSHMYACDLMPRLLDQLRNKAEAENLTNISYICKNCTDLSMIPDNSCDAVLCMGPLYHLSTEKDRIQCINEVKRILNNEGIAIFSYLTVRALWANARYKKMTLEELYRVDDLDRVIMPPFVFITPTEMENELHKSFLKINSHCAVDAITSFALKEVNQLSKQEYAMWVKLMEKHMYEKSFIEFSSHNLISVHL